MTEKSEESIKIVTGERFETLWQRRPSKELRLSDDELEALLQMQRSPAMKLSTYGEALAFKTKPFKRYLIVISALAVMYIGAFLIGASQYQKMPLRQYHQPRGSTRRPLHVDHLYQCRLVP